MVSRATRLAPHLALIFCLENAPRNLEPIILVAEYQSISGN
jgi:hypothetical protein